MCACVCLCARCPLQAVEELFNLMQLFVAQRADMREEELEDIKQFKKTTISCYLRCLDGRSCWTTLISAFRVLLENDEDRLLVVFNRGLILMTEVRPEALSDRNPNRVVMISNVSLSVCCSPSTPCT